MPRQEEKKKESTIVTLGPLTSFNGKLSFQETLRIQGKFNGTIEAQGALIVDREAVVEADRITVSSLTVYGTVVGNVCVLDKVDMMSGATVKGDVTAVRLRIADGVQFEGQCSMIGAGKEVEIFSRPTEEIKAELLKNKAAAH